MKALHWKIRSSQKVIKSALERFQPKIAVAWTGGKDSTVLLHMIREVNKEKVSIPVMFIDTGLHFEETLSFVKRLEKEWKLKVVRVTDKHTTREYRKTKSRLKKKELARMIKIRAIKKAVKRNKWKALIVGIRWDEHQARASEVYFSARKNHMRIHPLLHFTEADIWDYIRERKLPYNALYDRGYRSIGEKDFTKPVKDTKSPERSGREKEKEKIMERLRALGYF
ncbi:phosphoadenosine phosphosulfate reductase family protein [Patescibacteria group bacterium]|nr:phosphoadenosine phosphosulfate reductase family protein [Patescibacteria group bacterium]